MPPRAGAGMLLAVAASACPIRSAAQQQLTVYAATSLTGAFTVLAASFEAKRPGTRVRLNFAGSQVLATQIEQGAKADVFASADRRWMEYLAERSVVSGAEVFARNRLVVVVPRSNPGRIRGVADLGRPGVKVVLAGAQVPAGAYSRLALRQLAAAPGFPRDFERQVLANLVSEEENVRSVAAKVQLGEADAGVVYRTDIEEAALALQVSRIALPACCDPIAEYSIAAVGGGRSELARAFIALVLSEAGQRELTDRGFLGAPGRVR